MLISIGENPDYRIYVSAESLLWLVGELGKLPMGNMLCIWILWWHLSIGTGLGIGIATLLNFSIETADEFWQESWLEDMEVLNLFGGRDREAADG